MYLLTTRGTFLSGYLRFLEFFAQLIKIEDSDKDIFIDENNQISNVYTNLEIFLSKNIFVIPRFHHLVFSYSIL